MSSKYKLEARLGGGGMAEVFVGSMAGAEGFARRVAIKRVLPGFSENPSFARMFIAEAKISSALQHPNIVSVIDFDRDDDARLYLVMELVEGKDLDALAASGPLPIPVIVFALTEALRGLGYAHDLPVMDDALGRGSPTIQFMKGVVHRDVSPHNVLLSWDGGVKVSDFGIAKARSATNATATEMIKGKPSYMSPEQANGEHLDGRSDLFALGVMFWELLCGRRLFAGEDTRAMLAAVLFREIPRPRSIRPDIPKDVERIVMKLLERDLPKRYATAEDAIADLLETESAPKDGRERLKRVLAERFPSQAPIRHSVLRERQEQYAAIPQHIPSYDRPTIAVSATSGSMAISPFGEQPTHARARSRAALLVGGALVGLIVLVTVVVVVTRRSDPEQPGGLASGTGSSNVVALETVDAREQPLPSVDASVLVDAAPASSQADAAPIAAPPDAAIAAVAVDASVIVSPRDAGVATVARSKPTVATKVDKRGTLEVRAFPSLTVYIDRKKIHDTPVTRQLPIGQHTLRLVNPDIGHDETITITITENKTTTIDRQGS